MPPMYTKSWGSIRGKTNFIPDEKKFIFNVDTFWFTLDIHNYDDVMDGWLRKELEAGRAELDDGKTNTIEVELANYDNPVAFEIGRGQAPVYAYQMRNKDYGFYFTKKKRADRTYPVKVQINQFVLWDKKVIGAYAEALEVLHRLGFTCGDAKPNRIDLCCHSDQFSWRLDDLSAKHFSYPQNLSKDNFPNFYKLNPSTGEFQTVEFGDRARMLTRIYNKSAEVRKKNKEYFLDIYRQKEMNADEVWNIEFELHRDLLKEFVDPLTGDPNYYDTIENLLSERGLNQLWTWLTNKQFKHDSKFWRVLQHGDPKQFVSTGDYVIRAKDIDSTVYREFKQIRGRLKKFILTSEQNKIEDAIVRFFEMYYEIEKSEGLNFEEEMVELKKMYHDRQINGLLTASQKLAIESNKQRNKKEKLIAPHDEQNNHM